MADRRGKSMNDKNIHSKIDSNLLNIIKENIDKTIQIVLKRIDNIENSLNCLENRIIIIENILNELKLSTKNKEIIKNPTESDFISKVFAYYEGKSLNNFIDYFKLDSLGFEYITAKEIEILNENINSIITEKVYNDLLPNNEKIQNELVGKFFYSIGGISRVSQKISNKLFSQLFEEFKNYISTYNNWLTFNHEEDRRNFSIWVKKSIKEKTYEYISINNINEIKNYLYENDDNINEFLLKIFHYLIALYLKCRIAFPIVEGSYTNDHCKYDANLMLDIVDKSGKAKRVNFCYLPELKSNGKVLKNGKYYVFTYIKDQTYQKKGKVFEFLQEDQKPQLYLIPNLQEFKYKFEKEKYLLKIIKPSISSEFKPLYTLYKYDDANNYYTSKNGEFIISPNDLKYRFRLNIQLVNNKQNSYNLSFY